MPAFRARHHFIRRNGPFAVTRPIRTSHEYDVANQEIAILSHKTLELNKKEYDRLELLSILVDAYEEENLQIVERPSPQDIVIFMREQHHMPQQELHALLGGVEQAAAFFAKERSLTASEIRELRNALRIPPGLLLE